MFGRKYAHQGGETLEPGEDIILSLASLFFSFVVPEQHFVGSSSIEESHVSGSSSCISTNSSLRIFAKSFCGSGMTL